MGTRKAMGQRFLSTLILTITMSMMVGMAVMAAEPPLKLRAEVDKAKVTTTDDFTFTVTVDSLPGIEAEIPEIGAKILGLRIVTYGSDGPTNDEGRMVTKKWYRLQADISGPYVLPAVEVSYRLKKDQAPLMAKTSEIFVEVVPPEGSPDAAKASKEAKGPGAEAAKDIHDIKAAIPHKRKITPLMALMALLILVLAGTLLYFFWWKKRRARPAPLPIPISPLEEALNSLSLLEKVPYQQGEDIKRFHFRLSDVIRNYVERQFSFSATDMTFEEIRSRINRLRGPDLSHKEKFLFVLKETDVVKYTDILFPREKGLELLQLSREFVRDTAPKPLAGENPTLPAEESVL